MASCLLISAPLRRRYLTATTLLHDTEQAKGVLPAMCVTTATKKKAT